jgi:glycine/D-amino acid oxidase-like deaminating enzyme
MKTYDWIVIGSGITGAALAYELTKIGFYVLLLDQQLRPENATHYSYGGLAYWSGMTPMTRLLGREAIARHRILSQELDADTQLRELDLLLTIAADCDPDAIAASYADCDIPPRLLSIQEASELEPLLNRQAIAGALTVKHGHIHPTATVQAYIQKFLRLGGEMQISQVLELQTASNTHISPLTDGVQFTGVKTTTATFHSANIVVCAGGLSRQLLKSAGIMMKLYFSHAEIIQTPPVDLRLHTLIMSAQLQRLQSETASTQVDELWNEPNNQPVPPILDTGAVQFLDGSLRLGQITRILTDPYATINPQTSENWLRASIGQVLPALGKLPGTWHHCLVAFSRDHLPLIGAIPNYEGIHIFSGFSSPLVIVPPLAERFAKFAAGQKDEIISQLSPNREN